MSRRRLLAGLGVLLGASLFTLTLVAGNSIRNLQPFSDPSGTLTTYSTQKKIDLSNPFFQQLGTNGRSCASCHVISDAWSVSAAHLQQRFQATQGLDPIFRPIDGANCPSADVSTLEARTSAYSLLLNKGLIRMSLPVPAGAEFSIMAINDPYACAETTSSRLALYRRPLPATSLRFLPAIMWDGREPNLTAQARTATLVHSQPTQLPSDAQLQQIVFFETSLFTAQSADNIAGSLTAKGARGGPTNLSQQTFFPGINPDGTNVFTLYSSWESFDGSTTAAQRGSIARGEMLFNNRPMRIFGVPGFNDVRGQDTVFGTCGTCHNAPNVGSSSSPNFMNIGTASFRDDLPSYTLLCTDGTEVLSSDPGRALITGKCADIAKFKIPSMRGLPARAPYFHDGSAATLLQVIDFYDQRFGMLLSPEEKVDLVAFLNSL
jgi:cytochrome c peroxidase